MEQARTLLSGDLPLSLQITLVQPGLSRAVLTVMRGNLFSAVDEFVLRRKVHSNQGSWPRISAATSNWLGLSDVFALKIRKHVLYRVSKPGQNWFGLEQNVVRAEGLEPSWAV
jgi:hypothetical protein